MAKKEITAVTQRPVKRIDDKLLRCLIKINNHISTENDIHFTKQDHSVLIEKIKMTDGNEPPDLIVYPMKPVLLVEKPVDPFG
jgi:hypothetical protein